jgi:hypothetical protein
MAAQKPNKRILGLVMPYAVTGVTAGSLATFSDRIAIGPESAGFWMLILLGACIGVSIAATAFFLATRKKAAE